MTPTATSEVTVREISERAWIIDLPRELTAASENALMGAYARASSDNQHVMILNFSGLQRLDGSGLQMLTLLLTRASRENLRCLAFGVSDHYQQVLALTRLDGDITTCASESEALAAADTSYQPNTRESPPAATSSDIANWALPVPRLKVNASGLPPQAVSLNVDGRRVSPPLHGFGQLWRKTYSIRLRGAAVSPAGLMRVWKESFAGFWPEGNGFYGSKAGIGPGDVSVLNLKLLGPMKLYTGVHVIYADDTSFTFETPEGHMYAGLITFSAFDDHGTTVAQVQPLTSASDPAYEIGIRLGLGQRIEDVFWHRTLENLAASFGAQGKAEQRNELIDGRVQWSRLLSIRYNAAMWTALYMLAAPLRWLRRIVMGGRQPARPTA